MNILKNIPHTSTTLRSLGLLVALSLFAASPAVAQAQNQDQDAIQKKLEQLQGKLQALNSEIYEVQSEANKLPDVRKALLNYNETLTAEMKKIDPENETLIDQRQATYEELLEMNAGGEMNAEKESQLQELGQKFNSIRQQLAQTEAQANQTENASEAMASYNALVMSKMTQIDPQIEDKIERRETIGREFTNLRNAIIQQQQ